MARVFGNFLATYLNEPLSSDATLATIPGGSSFENFTLPTDNILQAVITQTVGGAIFREIVSITNIDIVNNTLTLVRGQEGTAAVTFTSPGDDDLMDAAVNTRANIAVVLTAGSLNLLSGTIDNNLIPDTNETRNIGSSDKRLDEIHARNINGVNQINDLVIPASSSEGTTLITSDDTTERDPGCFDGTLCAYSHDSELTEGTLYRLAGEEHGDLVFIQLWNTDDQAEEGANGGLCRLVAITNGSFNALDTLFDADVLDGTTTAQDWNIPIFLAFTAVDISFTDPDPETGQWGAVEFRNRTALTASEFRVFLESTSVGTTQFRTPRGVLAVQTDGYIENLDANNVHMRGKITVLGSPAVIAGTTIIKHELNATRAPAATDDSTDDYAVGSLWIYKGLMWRCHDVTEDEARWLLVGGGDGFIPIYESYTSGRGFHTGGPHAVNNDSFSDTLFNPYLYSDFERIRFSVVRGLSEVFLEDYYENSAITTPASFLADGLNISTPETRNDPITVNSQGDDGNGFIVTASTNIGSLFIVRVRVFGSYLTE